MNFKFNAVELKGSIKKGKVIYLNNNFHIKSSNNTIYLLPDEIINLKSKVLYTRPENKVYSEWTRKENTGVNTSAIAYLQKYWADIKPGITVSFTINKLNIVTKYDVVKK